jgi:hypothetical protein
MWMQVKVMPTDFSKPSFSFTGVELHARTPPVATEATV